MKLQKWTRWTAVILILLSLLVVLACKTPNQAPTITNITSASISITPGGDTTITCTATDPDGDTITYSWTVTGGTVSGTGGTITWEAPGAEGTYTISVEVSDGKGGTDTDSVSIEVAVGNNPPNITSVTPGDVSVSPGGSTTVTCTATDPDGDPLTYTWSAPDGGAISGTGSSVTWQAPAAEDTYGIEVTVSDGKGGTDSGSTNIVVVLVATTGSIDVQSSPAGAKVYLDGVDTGNITPYVITNVPAGGHTVRLTYYHYEDEQGPVAVTAGGTQYVNWALTYSPTQSATIQPDAAAGKDSYSTEGSPTGTSGTNTWLTSSVDTFGICRPHLEFDLGGIPSTAIVIDADFYCYYYTGPTASVRTLNAHRVTGAWNEGTLNWNNQPTYDSGTVAGSATVPAAPGAGFRDWDIDDLAQGWIDGTFTNHGLVLVDADETTTEGYKWFYSSDWGTANERPKMIIQYYDPAP